MDYFITGTTYKLIFMCIIQGTYGTNTRHYESKTAVEGNNISLPCIVDEADTNIIQMEWIKRQHGIDEKIVVFHPYYPIKYFKNDSVVEGRNNIETGKLEGCVLNLMKVTVNDSGDYVCEITSFPFGSIKKTTKVNVTASSVSLKMSYPYGFVKEGDEVNIGCLASPPPLRYELRRSKDELFLLESWSGEFILANVSRNNSDLYVCYPKWDTSAQHQHGLNFTMELTVNFLDSTECNTSNPLNVTVGENVMISCKTKASQPLLYKWMKGDTTVSFSDTLSLSSVTSDQSGTYKLTAAFPNNQLWTDKEFLIHVLPETSEESTTLTTSSSMRSFSTSYPFLNQTTEPLNNFTSVVASSLPTTMKTSQSSHFPTSTTQPSVTATVEHRNTSHHSAVNDSSPASPAGSASTLQPHFGNPTSTSNTINTSTAAVPTIRWKLVTFLVTNNSTVNFTLSSTTVKTKKASKSVAYIIIPILLLLLVLVALLYRRHLIQKRMDMPPSFKPPPPPVKYTSVRTHDIKLTDILV